MWGNKYVDAYVYLLYAKWMSKALASPPYSLGRASFGILSSKAALHFFLSESKMLIFASVFPARTGLMNLKACQNTVGAEFSQFRNLQNQTC